METPKQIKETQMNSQNTNLGRLNTHKKHSAQPGCMNRSW